MLLFYKPSLRFIRVHALVHLWSPVDTSFRWYGYFFLWFLEQPFSGFVGDADYHHMVILIGPSRLLSALFWGIRYIIEGPPLYFLCRTFFWRRIWSCLWILSHCQFLYGLLRFLFCPVLLEVSALVSGFMIFDHSYGDVLTGFMSLVLPVWQGLWSSQKDCLLLFGFLLPT